MVDFNYQPLHLVSELKTPEYSEPSTNYVLKQRISPHQVRSTWGLTGHNGAWALSFLDLDSDELLPEPENDGFGSDDFFRISIGWFF